MLVKSGADANLPMGDGQTAVHVAAVGGNLAVLRVLLQNGGDAQIADKEGETALHKVKSLSFFLSFRY
jgi:ankyrin repeat protein